MADTDRYKIIDSQDRSTGTSSNCVIKMAEPIRKVKRVKLNNLIITSSIYNVVTGVNDRLDFNDGIANLAALISPGAYSITTLMSTIATAMTAASASWGNVTFTGSFNTTTLKCSISAATNFSLKLSTGSNSSRSIGSTIGFPASDTSAATSQTASNIPILSKPFLLYLYIPELGRSFQTTCGDSATFVVPITENSSTGGMVFYNNGDFPQELNFTQPTTIHAITVQLLTRANTAVSINGGEWLMIWEMEYFD
jgi:hypothetical protein